MLLRTNPPVNLSDFARSAGVQRVAVYRVMNGERWRHIDVDFAIAMRDVTKGQIQIEDCSSITAVPVDRADTDDEEPRRRARRLAASERSLTAAAAEST